MTPSDLRATLARLELTQAGLARLLGVEPRTVRHWIAGTRSMPRGVALLLRAMECWPEVRAWAVEQ